MNPILQAFWNRLLGGRGEREAAIHLRRQGLRILHRGYRTDHGEIDLWPATATSLVFVEVKARRHGDPAEAVTPEKQRRLTLAALHYPQDGTVCSSSAAASTSWPSSGPTIRRLHESSTSATPSRPSAGGRCSGEA